MSEVPRGQRAQRLVRSAESLDRTNPPATRATSQETLRDLGLFVFKHAVCLGGGRSRFHGLHAYDEDLCWAHSEQKAQTQHGFLRSSPKGQGPKNPFHLARGLTEGRGGGGSGPGSASQRPGATDLPGCSAWPPASMLATWLLFPGPESGDASSPPPTSSAPRVGARAPEARRLWPDRGEAGSVAFPGSVRV